MNYQELQHIVRQLAFDLSRARLDQISDSPQQLQLAFYTREKKRACLVIDFHPTHLDILLSSSPLKSPPAPQAFTMLLRKHILNKRLAGIRISPDDRIVTLEFGDESSPDFALIAELTGRAPKIFFIEAQSLHILGMIGRDESRGIHEPYIPPPPGRIPNAPDRFQNLNANALYNAVETQIRARNENEMTENLRAQLLRQLKSASARASRLANSLQNDLQRAQCAEENRIQTDILNAYAYCIPKGASEITLPDFQTAAPVRIILDPTLPIHTQIEQRYNHCKRLAKAKPNIESRLQNTVNALSMLNAARLQIENADNIPALQNLLPTCAKLCKPFENKKLCATPRNTTPSKKKKDTHTPYKTFFSADGTRILVGKTALDNDTLTLRCSRGNDFWLHAANIPGSHVVVKSANPSQDTILDAAILAKHYSKLAQAENAEIQITQVKYIKKIKTDPPGKVQIHNERLVNIHSDATRLARILATQINI